MPGGGEPGHVRADLGEDDLGAFRADTGDLGDELVDACGEPVDLGVEGVDLTEQDLRQFAVVLVELAGQRFDQRVVLASHPAPGQTGEDGRVAFTRDERLDHLPDRQGGHRGRDRRNLDQCVLEELLEALVIAGTVPGQIHPHPDVVTRTRI
jgi:hypothetical protein